VSNFNKTLVQYLDFLNKILAGFFIAVAVLKFSDLALEYNFIGAILESLSVLGIGTLTCGYIALMININRVLEEIRDKLK
jgi:hypothetical protein